MKKKQSFIRKLILLSFLGLVAAQAYVLFTSPDCPPKFDDFKIYYDSGLKALNHETVYSPKEDWPGKTQFKYSPFVALFFGTTISQIPFEISKWVFYGASVLAWIGFVVLFYRRAGSNKWSWGKTLIGVAIFLVFFCNALRNEVGLGQANWIPLLLLFIFFQGYERRTRNFWVVGAALVSLAVQFKLYSVVAVYYLVVRKEFRMILSVIGVTLLTNFLFLGVFHGWGFTLSENLHWIDSLTSSSQALLASGDNVSLMGVLSKKLETPSIIAAIWLALCGVAFGFLALKPLRPELAYCYLMLMIAIFNPLVWPYWVLMAAPAFLYTVVSFQKPMDLRLPWIPAALLLLLLTNSIDRQIARDGGVIAAALVILAGFMWRASTAKNYP